MQELWLDKLDWDSPLSSTLTSKWHQFMTELSLLSNISIPRYINVRCTRDVQLLGFADASQKGYAASVYLRIIDSLGNVCIHFITCKTKVAPLKSSKVDVALTIPRLELCAAQLLAQILSQRRTVIQDIINITCVRAWTDSSIVLAWLTKKQKVFKIFVTNRVAKIKVLIPDCKWAHVGSLDNPADPASRGILPQELLLCPLHLSGPQFLRYCEDQWPSSKFRETNLPILEQLPEVKGTAQCAYLVQHDHEPEELFRRFSSLSKLQPVLGQCFRFIARTRKEPVVSGPITPLELDRVLAACIRTTQCLYWPQLGRQLADDRSTITPNTLAQLRLRSTFDYSR